MSPDVAQTSTHDAAAGAGDELRASQPGAKHLGGVPILIGTGATMAPNVAR
jgi:hypothetical protein